MNRITKVIITVATSIISVDVLLMVINGTMLYVILTMCGLYLIASLSFKQWAYKVIYNWIQGNSPAGDNNHKHFTQTD